MGVADREVVFCPYQGVGHVNPAIVFADKLSKAFGIRSRILIGGRQLYNKVTGQQNQTNIDIVLELLEIQESDNEKSHAARQISHGVRNLETHDLGKPFDDHAEAACKRVQELAASVSPPFCVLFDFCLLTSDRISAAGEPFLKIPNLCLFSPLSVASVALMIGGVHESVRWDHEKSALIVPNLPPLLQRDLCIAPEMQNMGDNLQAQMKLFDTIVFNSCEELESGPLITIRDFFGKSFAKNLFALGPLLADSYFKDDLDFPKTEGTLLYREWLDLQPKESVLFICFGSWIQLSEDQIRELAMGLESSKHRFLWVVPSDDQADILPEGFKERTKNQGLIAVGWAPQQMILSHASIGAFVSVCGWNSVLESVCLGGIPMLCWPMFGDQLTNCRVLVDGLKIGVEVVGDKDAAGLVRRGEVCCAVKAVMEDEELQRTAKSLKSAVRKSGQESKVFREFASQHL